jgi:hypothetical protein
MKLKVQRIRTHTLRLTVEMLEPGIAFVDALENELKSEASGKRPREGRLASSHHTGDAEKHD